MAQRQMEWSHSICVNFHHIISMDPDYLYDTQLFVPWFLLIFTFFLYQNQSVCPIRSIAISYVEWYHSFFRFDMVCDWKPYIPKQINILCHSLTHFDRFTLWIFHYPCDTLLLSIEMRYRTLLLLMLGGKTQIMIFTVCLLACEACSITYLDAFMYCVFIMHPSGTFEYFFISWICWAFTHFSSHLRKAAREKKETKKLNHIFAS